MNAINRSSKILILSDSDLYGGASVAGYNLHQSLRNQGFQSLMLVNNKISKIQQSYKMNTGINIGYTI